MRFRVTLVEERPFPAVSARQTPVDSAIITWMHGSRIVTADGQPLLCYHGTRAPQAPLRPTGAQGAQLGAGLYVTNSRTYASTYGPHVRSFYVRCLRPLDEHTLLDRVFDIWNGRWPNDDYDPEDRRHVARFNTLVAKVLQTGNHDGVWGWIDPGVLQIMVPTADQLREVPTPDKP